MLTPSYGLDYIANCKKSGFHPHPQEPPLFEVRSRGHVVTSGDLAATGMCGLAFCVQLMGWDLEDRLQQTVVS